MGARQLPKSASFWDKRSNKYEEDIKHHDSTYDERIDKTKSLLKRSDVVMDFACATGEISLDIAPNVQQILGIDLSVKMIELATQKAQDRQMENVSFLQTDAFDQGLELGSYSAIMAFSIFHLVPDVPKILDRLHDLLAPGGLLISETPCLGDRSWFLQALIKTASKIGLAPSIRSFTSSGLETLVGSRNYQIIESEILDARHASRWIVARKGQ